MTSHRLARLRLEPAHRITTTLTAWSIAQALALAVLAGTRTAGGFGWPGPVIADFALGAVLTLGGLGVAARFATTGLKAAPLVRGYLAVRVLGVLITLVMPGPGTASLLAALVCLGLVVTVAVDLHEASAAPVQDGEGLTEPQSTLAVDEVGAGSDPEP